MIYINLHDIYGEATVKNGFNKSDNYISRIDKQKKTDFLPVTTN